MSFSYSAMKNYIFITDLKTREKGRFFFFFISISSGCSAELLRTALLSHDSFPKQSGGQSENLRQRRILEALQCILSFEGSRVGQGWKWEDKLLLDCILTPQFWHLKNRSWKHVSHLIIFRIKWTTHKKSLLAHPIHSLTFLPLVWEPPGGRGQVLLAHCCAPAPGTECKQNALAWIDACCLCV